MARATERSPIPDPKGADDRTGLLSSFRSGGWIFALAGILVFAVIAWGVSAVLRAGGSRALGDGRDPASYGFDLTSLIVPRDLLAATGLPKDGLPALDTPKPSAPAEAIGRRRRKLLVPDDRVIGVVLGASARAYPLRVLVWHEVVNDTLGGRAIAVAYSPLGDAAVAFDRTVGGDTLRFGVSGLLYNSNHLLYDRHATPALESLWSPLAMRAISGPATRAPEANGRVALLPCQLMHWEDWLERHPHTTVITGDPKRVDRYRRDPYLSTFGSPELPFPVRPLAPPPEERELRDDEVPGAYLKDRVLALCVGGTWRAYSHVQIAAWAREEGVEGTGDAFTVQRDGLRMRLRHRRDPSAVEVELESGRLEATAHAFRYAWYALGKPRPEGADTRDALTLSSSGPPPR